VDGALSGSDRKRDEPIPLQKGMEQGSFDDDPARGASRGGSGRPFRVT
jgi:hypothetical protein